MKESTKWFYLPIILIVVVWLFYPLLLKLMMFFGSMILPDSMLIPVNYGEFGDMYGAVNTLFTGLAFAVLIWTTRQQQKEIKIQGDLLELQHKESKEQTKHLEDQAKYLKQQADNLTEQLSLFRKEIDLKQEELEQRNIEISLEEKRRSLNITIGDCSMVINHKDGKWELQYSVSIINRGETASNVKFEISKDTKNKIPKLQTLTNQQDQNLLFQIISDKYGTRYKEPIADEVLKVADSLILTVTYDNLDNEEVSLQWNLITNPIEDDKRNFNVKAEILLHE